MNPGDKAYIIESNKIKEVEVIKITRDFITVRYKTYLPSKFGNTFESTGGLRLRKSRVFEDELSAKKYLSSRK